MEMFHVPFFQNPPTQYQVVFAWVWNSRITRELIDRELSEMAEMGIRGVYIIPLPEDFRPGKMYTPLEPGYLSEAYMELIRYAAEASKKRNMAFWIYDEGGWPSGGADHRVTAFHPELTRITLLEQKSTLPAGIAYRQGDAVLAAFADGRRIFAGDRFEECAELTEYVRCRHAGTGLAEAMDPRATALFLQETHERYAAALQGMIGDTVRFMFTDEPCSGNYPWCEGFDQLFEERFHYSILDYLPSVLHPESYLEEKEIKARIDYRTLCGELFRKHYLEPIRIWCAEHGMLSTGHLGGEDTTTAGWRNGYGSVLASLRHLDMPGIDLIWRQLKAPGMEVQTDSSEIPFFPRIAPSAARQIGRKLSVSESFNIFGSGLTGEQIRYLANYQYVRGITVMNGMSVPSGREKGLALAMRPAYTPEVPGAGHLRALYQAFARTQYLLQLGDPAGTAALYTPDNDFLAEGKIAAEAAESFRAKGMELEEKGLDFDYIDDEAIRNAELRDGALWIGKAVYRKIYLPQCRFMPEDVREKLSHVAEEEPEQVLNCDCTGVRGRKLMLSDGGRLYFAFLESGEPSDVHFEFRETCPGYLLNVEDGTIKALRGQKAEVFLQVGQSCVFLFTEQPIPSEVLEDCYVAAAQGQISCFTASVQSAFRIDSMGIRKDIFPADFHPVQLEGWPRDFSGEYVYRFTLHPEDLEEGVLPGDRIRLKLGKVCYSARIWVNGREAGIAAAAPYEVCFPAVSGSMTIDIETANTPANEILSTKAFADWPEGYLQEMYHTRSSAFEQESLDGGLYGPVEWILERPVCRKEKYS